MYSSNMNKNQLQEQVIGIPVHLPAAYSGDKATKCYLPDPSAKTQFQVSSSANKSTSGKLVDSMLKRMNKIGKSADDFANGVREHVKLGTKISETVKGKLRLGAKIIQEGGMEKIFKRLFSVREEEKLLKACQCYLSTTAGPIAGLLFISTDKVAFCSERSSITIPSPNGELIKVHYKVLIPLSKIKRVYQSENVKKASQKYIEIVTVDGFYFWFMGFFNYRGAFENLQQAVSQIFK